MSKKKCKSFLSLALLFAILAGVLPFIPPVNVQAASSAPNVSEIRGVSGDFERDPDVTMDGHKVSAQRYIAMVDGIGYEAYCGDPKLRGPESAGAVYELSGPGKTALKNALKNGYPINSEWSNFDVDEDDRMWSAYVTRVAVAIANNPANTFAGDTVAIEQAKKLASGGVTTNVNAYPPIMVNGIKDVSDKGRSIKEADAKSQVFEITYNRKTSNTSNPFRFEWAAGTPAGAKLIVDGTVIATAPANSDKVFGASVKSFQIEMPNSAVYDGKTAAVNLVGIHNQFADTVWMLQNPNNPDGWQDIVFYIPEVSASAAFSFQANEDEPGTPSTPTPTPQTPDTPATGVKIQKIDALTRQNIPGTLVRLQGMSASTVTLPDGQIISFNNTGINISQVLTNGAETASGDVKSTVKDGVWEITGLPYGMYMVYEERAPENYSLLPQHTAYGFFLAPPDVEVKVEMPELEFSGSASESEVTVNITLGDDVDFSGSGSGDPEAGWNWEDSFTVTPPLPDFEIVESLNTNAVLITFENYPFGKIEVNKYDMVTELPLAGAHFRIQGYFAEGNTNGMPIDRVGITGADGKLVFEDLPAGQYTISEIEAPDGYELSKPSFRSISLTWGQTESTAFYDKPKTRLEVIKVDGDTNVKLAGAIFRLTDPTTGEFWEGETAADGRILLGAGDGSRGNQLESETTYILTEIQAPPGYVLDPAPREVVLGANNIPNSLTFANYLKPTLTVIKYDELTNLPLAGASFRLWKTEGETWSETQITGADGKIIWTDLGPGIYSVQEIDEPYGYFKDPARKEILLEGGDNKQLEFFNRPRPILTILKRDAITGKPLADVKFKVQKLEGATVGEFLTDANGRIELSPSTGYLLTEEIYRVTEIVPPNEYLLSANPQKDVLLKWYEPTELIFENVLKPTLIFIKSDGMSGRGISGATYKVEYESPTGGVTNIGSYVTKCGLIVLPHVLPGWYSLTETSPATGYQLPTNPTQRLHLAPGENSYTYAQTHEDLYVDARTNPNSGQRGTCGDWCGYLCSVLCAGSCGNAGDGTMASGNGGAFGNITITNGNGEVIGGNTGGTTDTTAPKLTAGTVTRLGNYSATITFTSSEAGRYYTAYTASGGNAPIISALSYGTDCAAGANIITVSLTTGAKDFYIKVKDAAGNVSDALKIVIPAYSATAPTETPDTPDFSGITIQGGTVVYLNQSPEFAGITITFGTP
ncbi:hypothetical protein FACS1894202_00910 [Clostridia bacterium]|nr:hypothetical protein FACS1894202_00910 [Clostridia bacterium]